MNKIYGIFKSEWDGEFQSTYLLGESLDDKDEICYSSKEKAIEAFNRIKEELKQLYFSYGYNKECTSNETFDNEIIEYELTNKYGCTHSITLQSIKLI